MSCVCVCRYFGWHNCFLSRTCKTIGGYFCHLFLNPNVCIVNINSILCLSFFSDIELRNIIDKLAKFVARNGPDFEQMTKNKQKGNAKFGFLFGGDHFNYYQYKVTTEQASKHYFFKHGIYRQS